MRPVRLGCRCTTWVGMVALAACRASVPGAAPAGAASPSGAASGTSSAVPGATTAGFTVVRHAESVPITALAFRAPYLWAGTPRGLRRWKVVAGHGKGDATDAEGDAESIGDETGLPGHRIGALGIDEEGGAWVATESGIGRLVAGGAHLRYQPRGTLAGVTLLVPSRGDGGAWAAGAGGLFRFDGHAWTVVEFLRDVAVTSLELDGDGRTAWVGTHGRGLFLVDEGGGKPIHATRDAAPDEEIVGTAASAGGARVVAIRAREGGRVIFITKDGPDEYRTQADAGVPFVRLQGAGANPVLVAGAPGAEHLYTLRPLPRGEPPPAGGFRLISARKGSTNRYAATPLALAVPPEVTVSAAREDSVAGGAGALAGAAAPPAIWFGSRLMGVARADAPRPRYLSGDLTEDADRFSVACVAVDRCVVVAGGTHAWSFDGAHFRETRVGETPVGRALAVAADGSGTAYGVSAEPPWKTLVISKLAPTRGASDAAGAGLDWQAQVVEKIPLAIGGARPALSFAAFSPAGNLWLGVDAVAGDGQELGRGALEITLASHRVVRHGAVAVAGAVAATGSRAGAKDRGGAVGASESLPLPHDLTRVIFDGTATWFASRSGISRWQESELRRWGENEHMNSEVCYGVAKGTDGKIWAATSAGVGRFDGNEWRFSAVSDGDARADGDAASATRAVVNDGGGRMWLATARGLRALGTSEASAPRLPPGQLVVDDEMLDLTLDRFGRVWALGGAAIAIVDTTSGTR